MVGGNTFLAVWLASKVSRYLSILCPQRHHAAQHKTEMMSYSQFKLGESRHVDDDDALTTCPVLRANAVEPRRLAIRSFLRQTSLMHLDCMIHTHSEWADRFSRVGTIHHMPDIQYSERTLSNHVGLPYVPSLADTSHAPWLDDIHSYSTRNSWLLLQKSSRAVSLLHTAQKGLGSSRSCDTVLRKLLHPSCLCSPSSEISSSPLRVAGGKLRAWRKVMAA